MLSVGRMYVAAGVTPLQKKDKILCVIPVPKLPAVYCGRQSLPRSEATLGRASGSRRAVGSSVGGLCP